MVALFSGVGQTYDTLGLSFSVDREKYFFEEKTSVCIMINGTNMGLWGWTDACEHLDHLEMTTTQFHTAVTLEA